MSLIAPVVPPLSSGAFESHALPPAIAGLEICLFRNFQPVPHVFVHSVHIDQSVMTQSNGDNFSKHGFVSLMLPPLAMQAALEPPLCGIFIIGRVRYV
jgi:hypothetical protein